MIDYKKLDTKTKVIDKLVSFENDVGVGSNAGLLIKHTQEIPQSFLDELDVIRAERINHHECGEMYHVARIPTGVVDEMIAEGFPFFNASVQEILKRVRQKELEKFITTNKRI